MSIETNISIINKTKGKLPRLPFVAMRDKILGPSYDLSISFVGKTASRTLNRTYREKDYPTNILSFELSKKSGELVLQPDCVKRDAKKFNMDFPNFLAFLLIHGMLHLKGMQHGSTMEKQEARFKKVFGVHETR